MRRAIPLALFLLMSAPVAGQQTAKPVPECVTLPKSHSDLTIRNQCKYPIHLELFDVARQELVQGELKPNQSMQGPPEAFGAICPAGFRSSVPLMLVNRPIFARDLYACVRQ